MQNCKESRPDYPQALDFFLRLKDAIKSGGRDTVSSFVRYPLRTHLNGKDTSIPSKAALLQDYDGIFDAYVRSAILSANEDDLWCNWQGFTILAGQIWWERSAEPDSEFVLITVNNGGDDNERGSSA
jgi:hypothetical protein